MLSAVSGQLQPSHFGANINQQLQDIASKLSIPTLTRLWQILLKGQQEIKQSHAQELAAEMVLIRCCYVQELLSAPAVKLTAAPIATPVPVVPTAVVKIASKPCPATFQELVQLFHEQRQMLLYHHLHDDVVLVSMQEQVLELRPLDAHKSAQLPRNFARQTKEMLDEWTAVSWQVNLLPFVGSAPEAQSLQVARLEQASSAKEALHAHPVVQSALSLFPGAEIAATNIKPS